MTTEECINALFDEIENVRSELYQQVETDIRQRMSNNPSIDLSSFTLVYFTHDPLALELRCGDEVVRSYRIKFVVRSDEETP